MGEGQAGENLEKLEKIGMTVDTDGRVGAGT